MAMNRLLSVLLLAGLVGTGSSGVLAAAAKAKAADPKAVKVQQMIDSAEKARKKASSVDSEWRDTGKFIKKAKVALKEGKYDKAMKLAIIAKNEGELGYQQGASQKELRIPPYLKYARVSNPAPAAAMVSMQGGKITTAMPSVEVMHKGKPVAISRTSDKNAVIPAEYSKIARVCPPFCVQPMQISKGVETVGELEVLDYLKRISGGDRTVLVVDSRTPEWIIRGTIPGSTNIPWNKINMEGEGAFAVDAEADNLSDILQNEFNARLVNGKWDFRNAKTLVMFCNGSWCPQSSMNIKTLVKLGYPTYKLKWYRGGMQDWVSVGLTTVNN